MYIYNNYINNYYFTIVINSLLLQLSYYIEIFHYSTTITIKNNYCNKFDNDVQTKRK